MFTSKEAVMVTDPYLKGASWWNRSQNHCCSASKAVHRWRRTLISFACSGATCCLTVMAIFFMLFHFSGSSCNGHLTVVRPTLFPPFITVLKLDRLQISSHLLQHLLQCRHIICSFSTTPLPWLTSLVSCSIDDHILWAQHYPSCPQPLTQ